jgi:uncharacterized RDD family membrane protein YckC
VSETHDMSGEKLGVRRPGNWMILPMVTGAFALLRPGLQTYSGTLVSMLLVGILIAAGPWLATRLPGAYGLTAGAAAIGCALSVNSLAGTIQSYWGSFGTLAVQAVMRLVAVGLFGATAVLAISGPQPKNPVTSGALAKAMSGTGVLLLIGLVLPDSGTNFLAANGLSHPGLYTLGWLFFLAVVGLGLVGLPLHRSLASRWIVAGFAAPLALNVFINGSDRQIPSRLVVIVGSLAVLGTLVAAFVTAAEVDAENSVSFLKSAALPTLPPAHTGLATVSAGQAASPGVIAPQVVYGSIGARFGALLIDGFISLAFLVPGYALTFASLSARRAGSQQALALLGLGLIVAGPIVNIVLYCINVGRRGQSWGHRACGVRVVDAVTGGPIGAGRAFGRLLMRAIAAIPCYLGLFWALWDPQHRGWHDMVARTVVVPAGNGAAAVGMPAAAPGFVPSPPSAPVLAPNSFAVAAPPAPIGYVQPMGVPALIPSVSVPSASPNLIGAAFTPEPIDQTINYRPKTPGTPLFKIVFDSGDEAPFNRSMLIGRDPVTAGPADESFALVRIVDPTMSVSKTHLALGLSDGAVWVEDRRSTNGVSVAAPNSGPADVTLGQRAPVELGSTVHFGSRWLRVERR